MATIRWKMGLDMGHPDGSAHETEGKGPCRMNEFFRYIGTEKTDGIAILGESKWDLSISF
jgi:hypothetical protein